MPPDLKPGAHIHCVGIGGYGISAIAQVLSQQGYAVSGCDLNAESSLLAPLRAAGIVVEAGHDPTHLDRFRPDALVISSAIPGDNAEIVTARQRGLPVFRRAEILSTITAAKKVIAVAGTHGKTTTTAMVTHVLSVCGRDPSFIIGGVAHDLGTNAKSGKGDLFVIEADEYDGMFLGLAPQVAIVTTLELDHPDMFADMEALRVVFQTFTDRLPRDGLLIAGHDSPETLQLGKRRSIQGRPALTYGLAGGTWQATGLLPNPRGGFDFTVRFMGTQTYPAGLEVPGQHNVQNALATLAAVNEFGISIAEAAPALASFTGVRRRFEVRGEQAGITVIDDYAHHPTAIRATLAAARKRYPGRPIWAVWQPHTYQRTALLLDDFSRAFADADHVVVIGIFRSRDKETFGVNEVDIITRLAHHRDATYRHEFDEIIDYLLTRVRTGEVVIVMSAGDATRISDALIARLGSLGRPV